MDMPNTLNEVEHRSVKRLKDGVDEACSNLCAKRVKYEEEIGKNLQHCGNEEADKVEPVSWEPNTDIHEDLALNTAPSKSGPTDTVQEMETVPDTQDHEVKTNDKVPNSSQSGCETIEQCTMIREHRVAEDQQIYFCDYCTMKYFEEKRAKQKCACEICGQSFNKKHHMRKHKELYHMDMSEMDMDL